MPKNSKPVYRLKDMLVEEVSLVDRAANRRRFLVTKNADGLSEDEIGEEITDETATAESLDQADQKEPGVEVTKAGTDFIDKVTKAAHSLVKLAEKVNKGYKPDKKLGTELAEQAATLLKLGAELNPSLMKSDEPSKEAELEEALKAEKARAEDAESRIEAVKAEKQAEIDRGLASIAALENNLADLTATVAESVSKSAEKVAKSSPEPEEDMLHPALADVEALTKQVENLHSQITRQAKTIQRLSKASLHSNTIPVEGSLVGPTETFKGWPADMADCPE